MRKLRAMIIVPFDQPGEDIRDSVQQALLELGVEVCRLDKVKATAHITNYTISAIESADFVIADISRRHPNVFYEVGYAHALRKPTFLIMNKDVESGLPVELTGNIYIVYDRQNLNKFKDQLKHFLKRHILDL